MDIENSPPHLPSFQHWLGTDISARSILSRLIHGFRINMIFAIELTIISILIGVLMGAIQGYWGGRTDIVIQRLIEIWASLPFIYILILLGSIYGRTFTLLLVVASIFQWIGVSYYVRAEFLREKNKVYVKVAKTIGMKPISILFKEILPNTLAPLVTLTPFMMISAIGTITSLDFLGFGLPPPTPSWGELLRQGIQNFSKPWIALSAVGALFITLLLMAFIGEGVREAFDPRSTIERKT